MCLALLTENIEMDAIKMSKTIKISENAHKALEYAKVMDGVKIGEFASAAIIEQIRTDYPNAYDALKKHLTTESNS